MRAKLSSPTLWNHTPQQRSSPHPAVFIPALCPTDLRWTRTLDSRFHSVFFSLSRHSYLIYRVLLSSFSIDIPTGSTERSPLRHQSRHGNKHWLRHRCHLQPHPSHPLPSPQLPARLGCQEPRQDWQQRSSSIARASQTVKYSCPSCSRRPAWSSLLI